jgi:hypothetical protein
MWHDSPVRMGGFARPMMWQLVARRDNTIEVMMWFYGHGPINWFSSRGIITRAVDFDMRIHYRSPSSV